MNKQRHLEDSNRGAGGGAEESSPVPGIRERKKEDEGEGGGNLRFRVPRKIRFCDESDDGSGRIGAKDRRRERFRFLSTERKQIGRAHV